MGMQAACDLIMDATLMTMTILAALAVQLVLQGLADLGIIAMVAH